MIVIIPGGSPAQVAVAQLLDVRPITDTMKTIALMVATAMLAIPLHGLATLTITKLGNGYYQIVAPGSVSPAFPPTYCVLQTSTNLTTWTSISTNVFPYTGAGDGVTNIIQGTASAAFYRVIVPGPVVTSP